MEHFWPNKKSSFYSQQLDAIYINKYEVKHNHSHLREDNGDDETVEADSFGKNQDEDHADKQLFVLSILDDSDVSDDTDSVARGDG